MIEYQTSCHDCAWSAESWNLTLIVEAWEIHTSLNPDHRTNGVYTKEDQ